MMLRQTAPAAASQDERVTLRRFRPHDIDAVISYWNRAFADQRNFTSLTAATFTRRILTCAAFDPGGFIMAWRQRSGTADRLVGLVHALKPAPKVGVYTTWDARHHIAVLHVDRAFRGRGIGGRLLQAAENWLYYCPVHVGGRMMPCYGSIEEPRPPLFGSSERMGIPATARNTIHFFAARGYGVDDPGDISMVRQLDGIRWPQPQAYDLAAHGLHMFQIDNEHPFVGTEPPGRERYTLWGKHSAPYGGLVVVDENRHLHGHISWYPMHDSATIALGEFWLAPDLRGRGIGTYLLDSGLHAMTVGLPRTLELQTHLVHHARAAALYADRGFTVDMAWVNLVKT